MYLSESSGRTALELAALFRHTNPALQRNRTRLTGTDMRIESKAPTRVDLAGGTLDIWPLYPFHPGAVTVNAAITRYASCVLETHSQSDRRIKLISRDTQREETFASLEAVVKAKRSRLPLLTELI